MRDAEGFDFGGEAGLELRELGGGEGGYVYCVGGGRHFGAFFGVGSNGLGGKGLVEKLGCFVVGALLTWLICLDGGAGERRFLICLGRARGGVKGVRGQTSLGYNCMIAGDVFFDLH